MVGLPCLIFCGDGQGVHSNPTFSAAPLQHSAVSVTVVGGLAFFLMSELLFPILPLLLTFVSPKRCSGCVRSNRHNRYTVILLGGCGRRLSRVGRRSASWFWGCSSCWFPFFLFCFGWCFSSVWWCLLSFWLFCVFFGLSVGRVVGGVGSFVGVVLVAALVRAWWCFLARLAVGRVWFRLRRCRRRVLVRSVLLPLPFWFPRGSFSRFGCSAPAPRGGANAPPSGVQPTPKM